MLMMKITYIEEQALISDDEQCTVHQDEMPALIAVLFLLMSQQGRIGKDIINAKSFDKMRNL